MELRQETWTENEWHEIIKKDGAVERTICTSGIFKPSAVLFFFFIADIGAALLFLLVEEWKEQRQLQFIDNYSVYQALYIYHGF